MKREKMNLGEKVAVICEGGAETAIMEICSIMRTLRLDTVLNFARVNLPANKDVFFIATAGNYKFFRQMWK